MALVPYHNTGNTIKHIGGISILPNETRMIDERFSPKQAQEEPDQPKEYGNPYADLLACSVPEIVDLLPKFTLEELDELEHMETASEKPRKSLLEALDKRRLELAQPE